VLSKLTVTVTEKRESINRIEKMTITEKYLDYIFPILYIEISQSQPVTAVSRLAVSHH